MYGLWGNMRAIEISQKVHLIRHWGKWYIVSRGATEWKRLGNVNLLRRTRSVEEIAKSLKDRDAAIERAGHHADHTANN
jgi:hypothetical protein